VWQSHPIIPSRITFYATLENWKDAKMGINITGLSFFDFETCIIASLHISIFAYITVFILVLICHCEQSEAISFT
jgi:hypothetical protein